MRIDHHIEVPVLATPGATPPTGYLFIYFKTDGLLYAKKSNGTESVVAGGGSGGGFTLYIEDTHFTGEFSNANPLAINLDNEAARINAIVSPAVANALETALAADQELPSKDIAGSHTIQANDMGNVLRFSGSAAKTATIALQSVIAYGAKRRVILRNNGTGDVTIGHDPTIVVNMPDAAKVIPQYGSVELHNIAANIWDGYSTVAGATAPPAAPAAPTVTGNDDSDTLSASHSGGNSVIYVSENNGAYTNYTGPIAVGNVNRSAGYWRFKATVNGVDSTIVNSPAFTVATVDPPVVAGDDSLNTLTASHPSGNGVIFVSENDGPYGSYTGPISVGDVARAAGYWKFRATINGINSNVVNSPEFTVAATGNTTPAAPTMTVDTVARTVDFTHALGDDEIEVSQNNSTSWVPMNFLGDWSGAQGKILVGPNARIAGYWRARIKAATGRNVSAEVASPEFLEQQNFAGKSTGMVEEGGNKITYNGGGVAGFGNVARSVYTVGSGQFFGFRLGGALGFDRAIGLTNSSNFTGKAQINHGIQINADGTVQAITNGVLSGVLATITAGHYLYFTYNSPTELLIEGSPDDSTFTTFATYTSPTAGPLYVGIDIEDTGGLFSNMYVANI